MRCLALAQGWRRVTGGPVVFASVEIPPPIRERVRSAGFEVARLDPSAQTEPEAVLSLAEQTSADGIVLDGYHFGRSHQHQIRSRARAPLLVLDDVGDRDGYDADLLLNQNIYAAPPMYDGLGPDTELLLGLEYCLLREEFLGAAAEPKVDPPTPRVLVTLGGGDPTNATRVVADGLSLVSCGIRPTVVVGGANPHRHALGGRCRELGFELVVAVDDMATRMKDSDLVVCAAGSTMWETLYLGVPSLCTVIADNQERIATSLTEEGLTRYLGRCTELIPEKVRDGVERAMEDREWRAHVATVGPERVDGRGADRVASAIQRHASRRS